MVNPKKVPLGKTLERYSLLNFKKPALDVQKELGATQRKW
jgi:hypothetical protein